MGDTCGSGGRPTDRWRRGVSRPVLALRVGGSRPDGVDEPRRHQVVRRRSHHDHRRVAHRHSPRLRWRTRRGRLGMEHRVVEELHLLVTRRIAVGIQRGTGGRPEPGCLRGHVDRSRRGGLRRARLGRARAGRPIHAGAVRAPPPRRPRPRRSVARPGAPSIEPGLLVAEIPRRSSSVRAGHRRTTPGGLAQRTSIRWRRWKRDHAESMPRIVRPTTGSTSGVGGCS